MSDTQWLMTGPITVTVDGVDHTVTSILHEDGSRCTLKSIAWFGMESGLAPGLTPAKPYKTITVDGESIEGTLDTYARLGFNCIRLPICQDVTWPGRTILNDNYAINGILNPDFITPEATPKTVNGVADCITAIEMIDKIIQHCRTLNMRVVLDMHCASPTTVNEHGFYGVWYTTPSPKGVGQTRGLVEEQRSEEQLIQAWEFLANRYKNEPVVCGFDLVNEPYKCYWNDDPLNGWPAAAERIAARIQRINPKVLIIVEGIQYQGKQTIGQDGLPGAEITWPGDYQYTGYSVYSQDLHQVAERPVVIPVQNRLVYSPHEYTNGNDYITRPNFPDNLPNVWDGLWGFIVKNQLGAIYIGEWGGNFEPVNGQDSIDKKYMTALQAYCEDWGISFSFWAGNGGELDGTVVGLFDQNDFSKILPNVQAINEVFNATPPNNDVFSMSIGMLSVQQQSLNFLPTLTDKESVEHSIRLYNAGNTPLQIGTLGSSSNFIVTQQPLATLAAGQTTQFRVKFVPQSGGNIKGTLALSTDAVSGYPNIILRGTGISTTLGVKNFLSVQQLAGIPTWNKGYTANVRYLDAGLQGRITAILTVEDGIPVKPQYGDAYIIPENSQDLWSGKDNQIAIFTAKGTWDYYTPTEGMRVFCEQDSSFYYYTGTIWKSELDQTIKSSPVFDGDHVVVSSNVSVNKSATVGGSCTFNATNTFTGSAVFNKPVTVNPPESVINGDVTADTLEITGQSEWADPVSLKGDVKFFNGLTIRKTFTMKGKVNLNSPNGFTVTARTPVAFGGGLKVGVGVSGNNDPTKFLSDVQFNSEVTYSNSMQTWNGFVKIDTGGVFSITAAHIIPFVNSIRLRSTLETDSVMTWTATATATVYGNITFNNSVTSSKSKFTRNIQFNNSTTLTGQIRMPFLSSADPKIYGRLWNNGGTLHISRG